MEDLSGAPQNTVSAAPNAGTITAIVLAVVFGVALVVAIVYIVMVQKDSEVDGPNNPSAGLQSTLAVTPADASAPALAAYMNNNAPAVAYMNNNAPAAAYMNNNAMYAPAVAAPFSPPIAAFYSPSPSPGPAGGYDIDGSAENDYDAGQPPTEGEVSQSAQAKALRRATRARQASERAAARAAGSLGPSNPAPAPASTDPAPSGSGKLGSAIATAGDKSLVHMANSKIANTGGMNDFVDDSAANMQLYAPDLKATMDKSLSLSGVSPAFGLDPTQTQLRKQQAIAENMVLAGTVDPSINQVLDASAPFIATSSAIRRAIAAQSSVNNETIIQTPLRFMWQSPLYRPAIPMATMSPITSDLMTPGQAFYLQSIACANGDGPVVQESF